MRTLRRFSLATAVAVTFLLTAATLLAYARTATTVPAIEQNIAALQAGIAASTITATGAVETATEITTETATDGKPVLSVGTPVDNVIFADQVRAVATETETDGDADVEGETILAADAPEQAPVPQDEPVRDEPGQAVNLGSFATLADRQMAIVESGGKPPLLRGTVVTDVPFVSAIPEAGSERARLQTQMQDAVVAAGGSGADGIELWYGLSQQFGNIGEPQFEINLLGTVLTLTRNFSATYSLNGGVEQPLHLGPDKRRLAQRGDFNAEIDFSELATGLNTIMITATDYTTTTLSQAVTVTYTPSNTWPINYQADWTAAGGDIQTVAQVVDGNWALEAGGLRPLVLSYDRLVGIGDITWSDYEVVVPVTIHGIDENGFDFPSNGPGIGLLLKWQGHYDRGGEQPDEGWRNFGALGWYRWSRTSEDGPILAGMQMLAYRGNEVDVNPNKVPAFDTPYMMKMSVQAQGPDQPAYYRFKTWPANQAEPATWDMEANGIKDEPATGSLLLLSHHVDVTFGTVTVRPLSAITATVKTGTDGNGSIQVNPPKDSYSYGETIELIANGTGEHVLESWGGDVSGDESPLRLKVTKDLSVTANFVIPTPSTVSATPQGNGTVKISPDKASYGYDEQVTITAIPESGFQFTGWTGSINSIQNPISIRMREDVTVTAIFEASAAPPISDDFNTCRLDESLWTTSDPKGDSTITVNGQQLVISVPAGSDHDLFTNKNFAPRILQSTPNTDFVVEAKFESALSQRFQTQGIIVEQDSDNLLRLEFYGDNDGVHIYAATFEDGTAQPRENTLITVPDGSAMFMRITRAGDTWTQEYSFDGATWQPHTTFEYALTVARSGVYGGNVDPDMRDEQDTSPAHTAIIDYFFNTAARIDNEDGDPLTVTINKNPQEGGEVSKSPDKVAYGCDEAITLNATANDGYQFGGWSGDITSGENPLTFTLRDGDTVTASFTEAITDGITIYLPIIRR